MAETVMADWCPICQQIGNICDVFGLTAADIRPESISQLHRAARDWRTAGYPDPRPMLHDPVLQGRSLWEILTAERVDLDAVNFIGAGMMMGALPDCRREGGGNGKLSRALADLSVEREKVKALEQAIESLADKFQKWAEEARREFIDPQRPIGEVVMKQRPQEIIYSEAVMLDICAREVRALLQPTQTVGKIDE